MDPRENVAKLPNQGSPVCRQEARAVNRLFTVSWLLPISLRTATWHDPLCPGLREIANYRPFAAVRTPAARVLCMQLDVHKHVGKN